ncbi:OmpH family outer membrane protein [Acidobacteriota bacterium]
MKTLNTLTCVLLFVLVSGFLFPAFAEMKVGICDTMQVLRESEEGKRRLEIYQKLAEKKEAELDSITQEVNRLQDQLKQLGTSIREDRRTDLERRLEDKVIEGTRKKKDAERELALMLDDIQEQMAKLIMPIIQEVGRDQGFSVIFNAQQAGVLYFDDTVEMTHEVIRRFNERVKKQ